MEKEIHGLVITRGPGDSVVITCSAGVMEIKVVRIRGNQVKLLFACGRQFKIDRNDRPEEPTCGAV